LVPEAGSQPTRIGQAVVDIQVWLLETECSYQCCF